MITKETGGKFSSAYNRQSPSDLTLSDLEKSKSRSLRFCRLIYRTGVQIHVDHMLLLKSNVI